MAENCSDDGIFSDDANGSDDAGGIFRWNDTVVVLAVVVVVVTVVWWYNSNGGGCVGSFGGSCGGYGEGGGDGVRLITGAASQWSPRTQTRKPDSPSSPSLITLHSPFLSPPHLPLPSTSPGPNSALSVFSPHSSPLLSPYHPLSPSFPFSYLSLS